MHERNPALLNSSGAYYERRRNNIFLVSALGFAAGRQCRVIGFGFEVWCVENGIGDDSFLIRCHLKDTSTVFVF